MTVLKASAAAVDVLRPRQRGVVVLLYHRVGGGAAIQTDLPRPLFQRQMDDLAAGTNVVGLDTALDAISQLPPAGHDPVVISFDDGTADFVDVALPLLEERRLPTTLYIATDFIERSVSFPHGGRPLSWAALRDVVATGLVTIGSHTHTHAPFDRVAPAGAAQELDRSIGLIQDRLDMTPRHFAYPKALRAPGAVESEVRSRFRSAALAGTRPNLYGATNPHRLARSPVQVADGLRWFRRKAAGGMAFEDAVRRATWRVRYAGRV